MLYVVYRNCDAIRSGIMMTPVEHFSETKHYRAQKNFQKLQNSGKCVKNNADNVNETKPTINLRLTTNEH